jgi:RNA dependent RNA polymerase
VVHPHTSAIVNHREDTENDGAEANSQDASKEAQEAHSVLRKEEHIESVCIRWVNDDIMTSPSIREKSSECSQDFENEQDKKRKRFGSSQGSNCEFVNTENSVNFPISEISIYSNPKEIEPLETYGDNYHNKGGHDQLHDCLLDGNRNGYVENSERQSHLETNYQTIELKSRGVETDLTSDPESHGKLSNPGSVIGKYRDDGINQQFDLRLESPQLTSSSGSEMSRNDVHQRSHASSDNSQGMIDMSVQDRQQRRHQDLIAVEVDGEFDETNNNITFHDSNDKSDKENGEIEVLMFSTQDIQALQKPQEIRANKGYSLSTSSSQIMAEELLQSSTNMDDKQCNTADFGNTDSNSLSSAHNSVNRSDQYMIESTQRKENVIPCRDSCSLDMTDGNNSDESSGLFSQDGNSESRSSRHAPQGYFFSDSRYDNGTLEVLIYHEDTCQSIWMNAMEVQQFDPHGLAAFLQSRDVVGQPGCEWTALNRNEDELEFPCVWKRQKKSFCPVTFAPNSPALVVREVPEVFFLRFLFGSDLLIRTIKLPAKSLPAKWNLFGKCYNLVCSKHIKRDQKSPIWNRDSDQGAQGYIKAYYVGRNEKYIAKSLCSIADFNDMTHSKAASRLELLVSPALIAPDGTPRAFWWHEDDLEVIEDNHTLGCGFAPTVFFSSLFPDQPCASCCQVRIITAKLGVFKGMLMSYPLSSKILLPLSMLKVKPSRSSDSCLEGKAFILVRGIFPSKSALMMNRHLHPQLSKPPPSSQFNLRPLSSMIKKILELAGLSSDCLEAYAYESATWRRRTWAFCVGVCDPTNSLPEGTVFVTGMGVGRNSVKKVYMTRCPCTEVGDGKLVERVHEKPLTMETEYWNFLKSLHFGVVIFANPQKENGLPLPPQISNGDLDGDQYFICWDDEILEILTAQNRDELKIHTEILEDTEESVDEKEEDLDPILGQQVRKVISGKSCIGTVIMKLTDMDKDEEPSYKCDFGKSGSLVLTRKQILKGRDFMDRILDHRQNGSSAEVFILWHFCQSTSWQRVDVLRRESEENASVLADYARDKELLNTKGWEWASALQRDARIVQVLDWKGEIFPNLKIQVMYDDGSIEWEKASDLADDPDDRNILKDYAVNQNLLRERAWSFVKESLGDSLIWFKGVQKILSDVTRLTEYNQLTENLHRAWLTSLRGVQDVNADTIALGRAFKQSLDICKHGGRVTLPFHLAHRVRKALRKHVDY